MKDFIQLLSDAMECSVMLAALAGGLAGAFIGLFWPLVLIILLVMK